MASERPPTTVMGLTLPQVAGGALAAVTAALAASRLGVTGTVLGAAFGSVISTVGGALYTHSIHRAHQRVTVTRQRLVRSPAQDRADPSALPTELDDGAQVVAESVTVVGPDAGDSTISASPTTRPTSSVPPASPPGSDPERAGRPIRWALVIGAAAVVFAVAMLAINVLEAVLGHPVSGGTSGTTITQIGGGSAPVAPTPTESTHPPAEVTPSDSATPQASPSEVAPTPGTPTPGPVDISPPPAAPTPTPTDAAPAASPAAS